MVRVELLGGRPHQLSGVLLARVAEVVVDRLDGGRHGVGHAPPKLLLRRRHSAVEGVIRMVLHRVHLGVLKVRPVLADGAVVPPVGRVASSEGSVRRRSLLWRHFLQQT